MKKYGVIKFVTVILAAVMLVSAAACGGAGKASELSFKNELSVDVDNFYVSPSDQTDWNDPVSDGRIGSGKTIGFDFAKFGGAEGMTVDIGAIDSSGMNYDVYEVVLRVGDCIILSGSATAAVYTITHADGTSETHTAETYSND